MKQTNARAPSPPVRVHHHNVFTAFGETKTFREWLEDDRRAVEKTTLRNRLSEGWDFARALTMRATEQPTKHPYARTKLYRVWINIKTRCYTPSQTRYRYYGARGIRVCDEWRTSFLAFREWALANGYREGLVFHRKDRDGDFCPDNCAFVHGQQRRGRRGRPVTAFGETKTPAEWAADARCQCCHHTLSARLRSGLSPEVAITASNDQLRRRGRRMLSAFGETKSLLAWLSDPRCRTSRWGLYLRLAAGIDFEIALTSPPFTFAKPKRKRETREAAEGS